MVNRKDFRPSERHSKGISDKDRALITKSNDKYKSETTTINNFKKNKYSKNGKYETDGETLYYNDDLIAYKKNKEIKTTFRFYLHFNNTEQTRILNKLYKKNKR